MSLRQILRTLGRRWYLVVLGLLLSGALGYAGYVFSPPQYEARGTILLLPSKDQMATGGRNPFLQLNNLDSIAGIVMARLNGDNVVTAFEEQYPTAEYVVQPDLTMRGPTIQVITTDETEPGALNTLNLLLADAEKTLGDVQAEQKVPKPAIVGSMRLVVDTAAEQQTDSTFRTAMAAAGAGILASGIMVFAIDGLLLRRRHNKQNQPAKPSRAKARKRPGKDEASATLFAEEALQPELPAAAPAPSEPTGQPAGRPRTTPRKRVSRPRRAGTVPLAASVNDQPEPAPEASLDGTVVPEGEPPLNGKAAPEGDALPARESPADNGTPAENETPADNDTSADNATSADNDTPADNETPTDNETPADNEASADSETRPENDEALAATDTSWRR